MYILLIAEKEIVMSKRTLNQTQTDSIYLERWFPLNPTPKILERKEGGGGTVEFIHEPN